MVLSQVQLMEREQISQDSGSASGSPGLEIHDGAGVGRAPCGRVPWWGRDGGFLPLEPLSLLVPGTAFTCWSLSALKLPPCSHPLLAGLAPCPAPGLLPAAPSPVTSQKGGRLSMVLNWSRKTLHAHHWTHKS